MLTPSTSKGLRLVQLNPHLDQDGSRRVEGPQPARIAHLEHRDVDDGRGEACAVARGAGSGGEIPAAKAATDNRAAQLNPERTTFYQARGATPAAAAAAAAAQAKVNHEKK